MRVWISIAANVPVFGAIGILNNQWYAYMTMPSHNDYLLNMYTQESATSHPLLAAWQRFPLDQFPCLLEGDDSLYNQGDRLLTYQRYEDFISSEQFGSTSIQFHVGLLPQPFIGNLAQASIFILLLNPGFSPGDYYAPQHSPAYARALERNLHQQNAADPYPFFYLDPQFAWTAGGQWWQARFRSVAQALVSQQRWSIQEAYQHISQHTACMEMYPYHSQSFKEPKTPLASKQLACDYVHDVLVPRALAGEALLVATRQVKEWRLSDKQHANIITYSGGQTRGAHVTMNTAGGDAIFQRLQALTQR